MDKIRGKKAAIELSMTTIVVVVLSLTLLIMGFILVRSIMCGAIGLTGQIKDKAEKQINDFFETSSNDVYCIGQGDPVKVSPGINFVYCGFNSKTGGTYNFEIREVTPLSSTISVADAKRIRLADKQEKVSVRPDEREARTIVTLEIPEDSPEGVVKVTLEMNKEGSNQKSTINVNWDISRQGVIRAVMCWKWKR